MRFRISPSTTPVVVQLSFSIPIDDPLLLLVIHYQSLPVAPPFPTGKIDRCRVYFSRSSRFWARPSHFWKPRDSEDCAYLLRSPWNTVEHRRSVPGNDGGSSRKLDDRYLRSSAPIVYTPMARSVLATRRPLCQMCSGEYREYRGRYSTGDSEWTWNNRCGCREGE